MDQLLALPVKGESFLLRRKGRHILVDGGYQGRTLAAALGKYAPNLETIDIVVCTHADQDHAGGLATLLDHWYVSRADGSVEPGKIDQFWLPGSWVDVLPNLMLAVRVFVQDLIAELDKLSYEKPEWARTDRDPEEFAAEIESEIAAIQASRRSDETVPAREEADARPDFWGEASDSEEWDLGSSDPVDEPGWFADLRSAIQDVRRTRPEAAKAFASARRRIRYRLGKRRIGTALAHYWLSLINTAANIRAIADHAIEYSVRIRWFDFDRFAKTRRPRGGVRGFLMPLNAIEQAPSPRLYLSCLARLSPINQACLTFIAPPGLDRLGVIFCGDSPLGDGPGYTTSFLKGLPAPVLPLVATAPHHGSENNRIAYDHLSKWTDVLVWLRTGGSKRQPGATFKHLKFPKRLCTHCPQSGLTIQAAGVGLTDGCDWLTGAIFWITGHRCCCL